MDEMGKTKHGPALHRHHSAMKVAAFDSIRALPVLETQAIHFMRVLNDGGVATNVFLRRLHNFSMGINRLPWPILPKKLWPKVVFKEKRAFTAKEHQGIVAHEENAERRGWTAMCLASFCVPRKGERRA